MLDGKMIKEKDFQELVKALGKAGASMIKEDVDLSELCPGEFIPKDTIAIHTGDDPEDYAFYCPSATIMYPALPHYDYEILKDFVRPLTKQEKLDVINTSKMLSASVWDAALKKIEKDD